MSNFQDGNSKTLSPVGGGVHNIKTDRDAYLGLGVTDDIFVSDRTTAEVAAYRAKVLGALVRWIRSSLPNPFLGDRSALKRKSIRS